MDYIIGSFTGFFLLILFHYIEKSRIVQLGKSKYLFWLYVLFCAYLLKPSEHFILWLAFTPIFYSVLDDIKTKTLNIYLPILSSLLFLLFIEKPYFFIYSFFLFLIFLIIIKVTKEKVMGEGDIYLFLPLSFLLLSRLPAFSLIGVAEIFIQALLISFLLAAVVLLPIKFFHSDISEFAFAPFLVLGCVIVYSQWSYTGVMLTILFLGTIILYLIYGILTWMKHIKNRKSEN